MAVTQGGAGYNKLARPDELISTPNNQHETSAIPPPHSIKRKLDDVEPPTASSDGEPYIKRTRPDSLPPSQELDNASTPSSKNSGVEVKSLGNCSKPQHKPIRPLDPTFGQRRQLPGLDDEEGEFSDGSTNEALTYLRNVRSEAYDIPHILAVPAPAVPEGTLDDSIYNTGYGDTRGFYSDGAYVAAPIIGPILPAPLSTRTQDEGSDTQTASLHTTDPQDAYRTRLRSRYNHLRTFLTTEPPSSALGRLASSPNTLITFPAQNHRAFSTWVATVRHAFPTPAQLSQMTHPTVLRVLRVVMATLKRHRNVSPTQSCWVWGLLGRLQEVGTLANEEVAVVRELGKRAIWVRCGFLGGVLAEGTAGFGGGDGLGQDGFGGEWVVEGADDGSGEEEGKLGAEVTNDEAEDEAGLVEEDLPTVGGVDGTADSVWGNDAERETLTRLNEMPAGPDALRDHHGGTDSPHSDAMSISASEDGEISDSPPMDSIASAKQRLLSKLVASASSSEDETEFDGDGGMDTQTYSRGRQANVSSVPRRRNTSSPLSSPDRKDGASEDSGVRKGKRSHERHQQYNGYNRRRRDILLPSSRYEAEARRLREVSKESKNEKLGKEAEEVPNANTMATIDMIITIAGEFYGQRDLLEFREAWGDEKSD